MKNRDLIYVSPRWFGALVLLFVVSAFFFSCQREEGYYKVSVLTQPYTGGGKVTLDDDHYACWTDGDEVWVNGQVCAMSVQGSRATMTVPASGDLRAVYPAFHVSEVSVEVTVPLPQVQKYRLSGDRQLVEAPMAAYASQGSGTITFYNLCSLLMLTNIPSGWDVQFVTVKNGGGTAICGSGTVNFSGGQPSLSALSDGRDSVVLDCRQNYNSANTVYVVIPPVAYSNLTVHVYVKEDGVMKRYEAVGTHSGTFQPNTIYQFTLPSAPTLQPASFTPVGAISGLFTVGADGHKVWFSQGKLQYLAKMNRWRFAENQYDFIESENSQISSTFNKWIDLFSWGTSGWNSGAICYQPYSIYRSNDHYYPGENQSNSLVGDYANADWGVYNAIENGGGTRGLWRTLTSAEWRYLLTGEGRSNRFGMYSLHEHYGLVLLPDDMIVPDNFSSSDTITDSEWIQWQNQGAVFLPLAGYRNVTTNNNNTHHTYWPYILTQDNHCYGGYWSSTATSSNTNADVLLLEVDYSGQGWSGSYSVGDKSRYQGYSVRLVADF